MAPLGPFWLAPLEGVSDVGFRRLCFTLGASLTFTEMIRAKALARRNKSTHNLIDTTDADVPTGVQLLATSATELTDALGVITEQAATTHPHWQNICAVDLNFGCPSRDVVQAGAGPALLKRRAKITSILQALADWKKSAPPSLPKLRTVSCKLRTGLNHNEHTHQVFLPVVEAANAVGLDHVTIHARHAGQRSRDKADWRAIAAAKKVSRIPVIGNGDVMSRADAVRMHEQTGCDGFLIARAAINSPWIFRALTEQGDAMPTVAEAEAAWSRYREQPQVAEKYRTFHDDNFARIVAVARGEQRSSVVPKNAHM